MIQFNLLPDVKLEFIRTQRIKRLVILVAIAVSAVAFVIMILLFTAVVIFQKQHMKHLSNDIKKYSSNLQATPGLNKVLTIQNQLNSLTTLEAEKPDTNRLIPYIEQVTPPTASIASLNVDFGADTMSITGSADSLSTVNQFVDTLKFTTTDADQSPKAFSNVVLASFGRADKGASYNITLQFDPSIFDNTKNVKLVVPNIVTTRSETEKPKVLFEPVTNSGSR